MNIPIWADLSRSSSPVTPALMIRRPYRNHALVDIEEHALLSVLPEYARESFRRPYDADAIIEQLILDSPELYPRTRQNYLHKEDIYDVYCWIIKTTSRARETDLNAVIEEGVLEGLEECLRHDRNGSVGLSSSFFHKRTQHMFRALADVSNRTRSTQIGTVLVDFFMRHASQIASSDASDALGQWCYAILRAHVGEVEQYECLRRVLRERPDLPSRLAGRGRKAEEVLERLELLSSRSSASSSLRDIAGRSNDLLSLDYGRSRSHSRDRPILLRSHSNNLNLNRRHEFDLGLRRRESAEDGLTNLLLAREDAVKQQQRRMLQLTMGRRYADRFDRPQPMGLGALGFGGDLGLLQLGYDDVEI